MVDLQVLNACGSTNERLRQFFEAKAPTETQVLTDAQRAAMKAEADTQRKFRDKINRRLNENIYFALKNYQFYTALDLAWDGPPISKKMYPLVMYAQGKIDVAKCAAQLTELGACAQSFIKKGPDGKPVDINIPKFTEVAVMLMRSVITRRLAAQSNKYNNLFPYFKYEARALSDVGKLRADLMSQRVDIMADQYGYKHHDTQVYRDAMLYGHSVDFIRAAWERDDAWKSAPKVEGNDSKEVKPEAFITREGLAWVKPHPTRVFWDNVGPMSEINDDLGSPGSYIGFWDVLRYRDVHQNMAFYNRAGIGYTSEYSQMFQTFSDYFSQYYSVIKAPPTSAQQNDQTAGNDRTNLVGVYSADNLDVSIVLANYFEKIIPKELGIGEYPYPVWTRFVVAGWDTVVYAEFLPSTPCAVLSYNEKDDRQINLGIGHELLSYQDQMSNLLSALLLALKSDNIKVIVIDTDCLSTEQIKNIRSEAAGGTLYTQTQIIEISRAKLQELGLKPEDVIKLVETKSSSQINLIFQAMLQLLSIVAQMQALSPQEQGQPAPREISATETNLIAGTTESVYNFISDAIDEFRAAKKRIIYESFVNFSQPNFQLPIIGEYSDETVKAAGLEVQGETGGGQPDTQPNPPVSIIGTREKLIADFVFTSRDGAERTSNLQTAQYLTEIFKTLLPIPAFQEALSKKQFKDMINEVFRLTGAFDLKLEPSANNADAEPLAPSADDRFQQILGQITNQLEQNTQQIGSLSKIVQKLTGSEQPTIPPPNANPSGAPNPTIPGAGSPNAPGPGLNAATG